MGEQNYDELYAQMTGIVIDCLLSEEFEITVMVGTQTYAPHCRDKQRILHNLRRGPVEHLVVYNDVKRVGWVALSYRKGPWTIPTDYSLSLDYCLGPAMVASAELYSRYLRGDLPSRGG